MKYEVSITGKIYVETTVEVEADNEEMASALALEKAADRPDGSFWTYYTTVPDSETLQVEDVTQIDPIPARY